MLPTWMILAVRGKNAVTMLQMSKKIVECGGVGFHK
jgi:hypothetical protein